MDKNLFKIRENGSKAKKHELSLARRGDQMLRVLYYFPSAYKNQYLSQENLRKFQEKRLRYIIDFAYRNTSFYKEKFRKANLTPHDIQTLEDLPKIPVTTKKEIKAVFPHGIVAPGYTEENCIVESTSGTSGDILKILYNPETYDHTTAVSLRNYLAHGVRPWHRFCVMCRDPVELQRASKGLFKAIGILESRPEEELVEDLRIHRPHVIGGHPSLMAALAKIAEEKKVDISPKLILIGGEMAYPFSRAYVERIFKCPTINKYGAYEAGSIAWECREHKKMHIDADTVITEFLKGGEPVSPGERGEIVITNLWNEAMPFIRYRLDDVGSASDEICQCGRTFPLIKELEGKSDDFIVLPSGELVPSTRVVPFFFMVPQIGEFKIIQDGKTHITLRIIPEEGFTEEMGEKVLKGVQNVLGDTVEVELEKVEYIEHRGSKLKRVQRTFACDLPFEKKG